MNSKQVMQFYREGLKEFNLHVLSCPSKTIM